MTRQRALVDLVPILPLHAAFRLGARLGYNHGDGITVHAASGEVFFPALRLTSVPSTNAAPLQVHPVAEFTGGDDMFTALALDLQGRGDRFVSLVDKTCRELGVGRRLLLSSLEYLSTNEQAFTAAIDQVCRVWRGTVVCRRVGRAVHRVPLRFRRHVCGARCTADPVRPRPLAGGDVGEDVEPVRLHGRRRVIATGS